MSKENKTTIDFMASFEEFVNFSLSHCGLGLRFDNLKEKQLDTLKSIFTGRDTISILPTGYGKSVLFQLLPWFLQKRNNLALPAIVLVISPLNSLIQDQLAQLRTTLIKACSVDITGSKVLTYDIPDIDDEDNSLLGLKPDVPFPSLKEGHFNLIYAHPEVFSSKVFMSLMRSNIYQERVGAVVIDEVHMISEWGEKFRPSFKMLGETTCIFNTAIHLALTATATESSIKNITSVLNYSSPSIIWANPDRPNIYLDVRKRLPNIHKFNKYDEFIKPISSELLSKNVNFPLTIIYVESLESLGYFFQFLTTELKENAFVGEPIPENRLFAQYHKDYPESMKQFIVKEIVKQNSRIRLVLATIALGMGLNAQSIVRIIHCRPPTTLEKYMQEIGRAGRNDQQSEAILYYNSSDISLSRKGLQAPVREFCLEEEKCLRLMLVQYFGFNSHLFDFDQKDCCSNCRRMCNTKSFKLIL